MSEIITHIAATGAGAGAIGYGMTQLNRVIGPSVKALGIALGDWSDYRVRNFLKLTAAADELSNASEEASVHPRVAQKVLDDATWLDDDVMLSYAGGMLAASRTEDGKEERGLYYVSVLSNLTSMQLRIHHAIYSALRDRVTGDIDLNQTFAPVEATIWIQTRSLARNWSATGLDPKVLDNEAPAALLALEREGLIGPSWSMLTAPTLTKMAGQEMPDLIMVQPSSFGIMLYLWGHGVRADMPAEIAEAELPDLEGPFVRDAVMCENYLPDHDGD